jgi:TetR/AcrR family transcriptional repressor of mexJK operon
VVQTSTGPQRRGRPPGRGGADLLAIARDQFIAHGFRGTTMNAVAARAGISKQTLYAAYPSKDQLYAAVVEDWVELGSDALRPDTLALAEATNVRDGLQRLATVLQAGILSPPVLAMRTLVAAEADSFPDVAADYGTRSWDHNLRMLAESLTVLTRRGLLAIDDPEVAAEQFVWLVVGAPLNRLSLQGAAHGYSARRLQHIVHEAVATFLSRYGRH